MKKMRKLHVLMLIAVCLLGLPGLIYAQQNNPFGALLGGSRGVDLQRLTVTQLETSPDRPRGDRPLTFKVVVDNDSRRDVRLDLAVVEGDRVIVQAYDVYLRPGKNRVEFPQVNFQQSRRGQDCFTIQTLIDRRWVPLNMPRQFCLESHRDQWIDLSVKALRMKPDPVKVGEKVSFSVTISNDGRRPVRGVIRIEDNDQVVAQTAPVEIPPGDKSFKVSGGQYRFQRLDNCFTVSVDVNRTAHRIDASEEFCAEPRSWTLKTRKKDRR